MTKPTLLKLLVICSLAVAVPTATSAATNIFAQTASIVANVTLSLTPGTHSPNLLTNAIVRPKLSTGTVKLDIALAAESFSASKVVTPSSFDRSVLDRQASKSISPLRKTKKDGSSPFPIWLIALMVFTFILCLTLIWEKSSTNRKNRNLEVSYHDPLHDALMQFLDLTPEVANPVVRRQMKEIGYNLEALYKLVKKADLDQTALDSFITLFGNHLASLVRVMRVYIDVQENRRNYVESDYIMREGRQVIADFSEYLRQRLRGGAKEAVLTAFGVDTPTRARPLNQ